jgi:HlyD family secretion protein
MKAWKFIWGPLIILVMSVTACSSAANQAVRPVQQITAIRGDLTTNISGSGKISIVTDARLSFGSGGKLLTLNVKEGDKVTNGQVLAKQDTSALELALAQAKVAQDQTQVGLAQAKVALDQANVAQIQANSALTAAQFNLDKIQAVGDIKDAITKLQQQITTAQVNMRQASATGDSAGANAMLQYTNDLQVELAKQNKRLATLLSGIEYTGANALTYDIYGQTYDRLVLQDIRMKALAIEAAQKVVDQSASGIALVQKTIDQANDGIALAQKNLDYIQKQINDATINAPFDGTVATLYYKQGDIIPSPVAAPQIVIYMVDTGNLEVAVNINELDSPAVQVGQNAIISLDAFPGTTLQGKVSAISVIPNAQAAAAGTTVYVAKVAFSVPQGLAVKTGMNASVNIISQVRKNVLLLPGEAIKQDRQGKTYVQVMNNQNITNQPVVTGAREGTNTEIVSGLKEGDKVVTGVAWSLQAN